MAKHLLSNDHCWTQTVGAVSELAEAVSAEMSVPGDRDPRPVWLWWSRIGAGPADVDRRENTSPLAIYPAHVERFTHTA